MDKKKIGIIAVVSLVLLIVLVLIILLFKKPKVEEEPVTYNFNLNGGNMIQISQNENYNDLFVTASDSNGNDLSKYVTVSNNVDVTKPGKYTVTYTLKIDDYENTITRYVIVTEESTDEYSLVLNGEDTVYVLKGTKYEDMGCAVYYNGELYSDKVFAINNININTPGNYTVNYSYNAAGDTKTASRNVIVYDVTYDVSLNNKDGYAEISFSTASEYYSHVTLSDGGNYETSNFLHKITKNGVYSLTIYDKFGKFVTEDVNVDIIYNDVSCSGSVTRIGTSISVAGADKDHITSYSWTIDGKTVSGNNTYKANYKKVKNATVDVTFKSGTTKKISCNITNKLVYEFKYDEFNAKPYMKCNTYTAEDKVRLDAQLKKAIDEAGYGTRAGVVEAARFLVGALDYKVHYLGPKTENFELGRYQKIGLNIGSKTSWGCMVSGWEQGIDCTNFVRWAFYQSGDDNPKITSASNTYKITEKLSVVQVGDLLLTPNNGDNASERAFTHVGIIIGIDSKYIYIAESTTGKIDALIVSKLDKSNLPTSGKFSIVKLYKYPSEGNVTNMWVS